MKNEYLNIYNNLIKLTRNKLLFEKITNKDSFSQRLMVFLFHFGFFLKIYKKDNTKKYLQKIYDFNFRQLELSVREIGYGDSTINKKMKQYVNIFYSIIDKVENRSEEHTSELQSRTNLVCRLLLEKNNKHFSTFSRLFALAAIV